MISYNSLEINLLKKPNKNLATNKKPLTKTIVSG